MINSEFSHPVFTQKSQKKSKFQMDIPETFSNANLSVNSVEQIPKKSLYNDKITLNYVMEIVDGQFAANEFISVKWDLIVGGNWELEAGIPTGVTHSAQANESLEQLASFNFISRYSLTTTNLQDFPRILLTLYGVDFLGRGVVKGYGVFHLPFHVGASVKKVRVFRPTPSSGIVGLFGYLFGKNPEYVDPVKTLVHGNSRKFTLTEPVGFVNIRFNVRGENITSNGFGKPNNQ